MRPRDADQNQGVLHVKGAVADGTWLLLTLANLTENAFALNMELGVLVRGGPLPGQVEARFGRLIETKQLLEIVNREDRLSQQKPRCGRFIA